MADRMCSVADCGKPVKTRQMCSMHYERWRGNNRTSVRPRAKSDGLAIWTELTSVAGDDCVLWPGEHVRGYGIVRVEGMSRRAHVLSCIAANGERPDGLQAAHSCGVSLCINPRHLRWATLSENQRDRLLHGTSSRGEQNGRHKLTGDQVDAIRAEWVPRVVTMQMLADRYGVSRSTVMSVMYRRSWNWTD